MPVDPAVLNDGHNSNTVSMVVSHDRGGPNYFHGGTEPAGYQFSIHPVERTDGGTRFVVGANVGRRYVIERTRAPFSAKTLAAHVLRLQGKTNELVANLIARNYDGLRAIVLPPAPAPAPEPRQVMEGDLSDGNDNVSGL